MIYGGVGKRVFRVNGVNISSSPGDGTVGGGFPPPHPQATGDSALPDPLS